MTADTSEGNQKKNVVYNRKCPKVPVAWTHSIHTIFIFPQGYKSIYALKIATEREKKIELLVAMGITN